MDKTKIEEVKNGILEHQLKSWKEFGEIITDGDFCAPTYIYRGQANSKWLVESTLDRMEKRFPKRPNLSSEVPNEFNCPRVDRALQLRRFKEMSRGKLSNLPQDNEENEWWTLAQHHGLATPMLDWTYSPFIALFFAFEEEKCWCNNEFKTPETRSVFVLAHHLVREHETNGSPAPRPFSPKGHANYRLANQGGIFLRMPYKYDQHIDLEKYVKENFKDETYREPNGQNKGNTSPREILQKFVIQNTDRIGCLKFLDHMNINRSSLFPDLDGAAQYVNALWEVNFDKALGHINDK